MMRSCEKCQENRWKFEYIEGWIRATCELCLWEVEFQSKKLTKKDERTNKIPKRTRDDRPIRPSLPETGPAKGRGFLDDYLRGLEKKLKS